MLVGDAPALPIRSAYIFRFLLNADKRVYLRDYSLAGSVWRSNSGSQSKSTKRFRAAKINSRYANTVWSPELEIKQERQTLKKRTKTRNTPKTRNGDQEKMKLKWETQPQESTNKLDHSWVALRFRQQEHRTVLTIPPVHASF